MSDQKEWVVKSPLHILKNKKGDKWYLNQNNYRNTHFQSLNNHKKKYKLQMEEQIRNLPRFERISITLRIHASNKRLFDIDNISAVHCKFFCDALTELQKIPEDNYLFVPEIHTYFGSVNKDDPHVEITIKEI